MSMTIAKARSLMFGVGNWVGAVDSNVDGRKDVVKEVGENDCVDGVSVGRNSGLQDGCLEG